jgi:hypothetical protein
VHQFLARHESELANYGDLGLLLVLLAGTDPAHPAAGRALERIERRLDGDATLNLQDLAWMLWGSASWPENPQARLVADRLFELIRTRYVDAGSGLACHSPARYRGHIVSFGSLVYFLRALHEYAGSSGSESARELFDAALRRVLAIQADDGAWPWMIDVRSGLPFDRYPIFTVHQDSMAMLFLFPAQDLRVVPEAIARSVRWNLGQNELGVRMVLSEPYPWIYRSIERDERWPRARRYLRGLGPAPKAYPRRSRRLRVNRECRSYHLGWVLYCWSSPDRQAQLQTIYKDG